ncbi:phage tail tip lysozyme [Hungatella hathewayi]|uniref:phage tail tip lysozyme n=1 Tax=Hungatella hathewayi TaxID=154046 RepID=UPI003567F8AD
MGRTRQREARQLHLNNIKKGAEKRADDDFRDALKKMTKINISDSTARDIAGVGKATSKMSGDMVNAKIKEVKKNIMNSTSNGEHSNTLMNFVGVSKIGYTLLVNSGVNISNNEKFLRDLKDVPDSVFSKDNIEELNRTLLNNKVITPENKLKIDTSNVYSSLKKIDKKINLYTRQTLGRELSNPKELISILEKAKKSGNTELASVIEAKIGIVESIYGKHASIKKTQKTVGSMRRMLAMNISDPVFQGVNSLVYYKSVTKTLVKTSSIYYKGLAKGLIKTSDFTVTGTAKVLDKVGLHKVSNNVMATRNVVANVGNGSYYQKAMTKLINPPDKGIKGTVGNFIINPVKSTKNMKMSLKNTMEKLPGNALHGVKVAGSATGKVIARGTGAAGNAIGQTSAYKVVAGSASRVYTRVASSSIGKATDRIGKAGGRVVKKVLRGGKKLTGIVTSPFKLVGKSILKGFNVINAILGKILAGVAGVAAAIAIFSTVIVLIIVSLSAIGDAVSTSLETFKTETTMGATYEKLVEKEREFNSAVANLINEEVPDEFKALGITKWTNYNVHYIGSDGKEMYGAYNYDAGVNIVGDGNFAIVINSTSDRIWTFLKQMGWNDYAITGIMGNIMNECSMNHTENSTVDAGIVQWTGSRRTAFMNWASSHGGWSNLDTQLRYLFVEPHYKDKVNTMGKTNWSSINAATDYFIDYYEMYKDYKTDTKERGERRSAAKSYYDYYTSNSDYADIEPDETLIAEVGASGGEGSDIEVADAGLSNYSSSTIKGILSMAAIYIDQDFKKYGSYTDKSSIFDDSLYKDYCAKLYDSTHIIGNDQTTPIIYYCPAYSAEISEPKYRVASESCNNKIPGGGSDEDWLNSGTGINRKFSLSMSKKLDSYETEDNDGNTDTHYYDKYTVLETGPHGTVYYTYDSDDDDRAQTANDARTKFLETGCKNYTLKVTDKGDGYTSYVYACHCDECKGHIDGNAYVFISNIYDPTEENIINNTEEDEDESDGADTDRDETVEGTDSEISTTKDNTEAFNNVDKKDAESRFSMYALDKYATAFDAPSGTGVIGTAVCPNINCMSNIPNEHTVPSTTVKLNEDGTPICSICENEISDYPEFKYGREGDEESVNQANTTENRSAEKAIMEELTGKPIVIKDWWNNENWFTNAFSTTKTYFRLYSGEESFDTLEKPDKNAEDQNMVNAGNSTSYWFNAYTSSSGRNIDFEKHGWDEDSITLVRLLMAGDWLELYGIHDFGGITGAPLTDAQLAQLIANTPEWRNLCSDRKAIIYATQSFQENVAKRFNTKYVYGAGHGALKTIDEITAADAFDCSSYVSTILYNAGMYYGSCLSTEGFASSNQFRVISYAELLPGDILVKGGKHVVLYMGGGNISHASTSSKPLKDTYNVPGLQYYINQGFTAMRSVNIRENIYDYEVEDGTNDEYDNNTIKEEQPEL